jgi:RNA polymerase sigma-70 factor (TIGR02943 family)
MSSPSISVDDPALWVEHFGDALFRYARAQVATDEIAEDLVQETFLAALKSRDRFQAKSSFLTWLVGILRYKIVDHHRREATSRARHPDNERAWEDVFFSTRRFWKKSPQAWRERPDAAAENAEFWDVLQRCLEKLPAKLSYAFRLRTLAEISFADICKKSNLTATNLSVRLHRARLLMRECLERNWFTK